MRYAALCLFFGSLCQAGEFTGYISDAACGWNNARSSPEAKECARKCVNVGWDPVFVRDGEMNTFKISDKRAVLAFVGEHVAIEGQLKGDTVTVRKIRKVTKASGKRKGS